MVASGSVSDVNINHHVSAFNYSGPHAQTEHLYPPPPAPTYKHRLAHFHSHTYWRSFVHFPQHDNSKKGARATFSPIFARCCVISVNERVYLLAARSSGIIMTVLCTLSLSVPCSLYTAPTLYPHCKNLPSLWKM